MKIICKYCGQYIDPFSACKYCGAPNGDGREEYNFIVTGKGYGPADQYKNGDIVSMTIQEAIPFLDKLKFADGRSWNNVELSSEIKYMFSHFLDDDTDQEEEE
jgi:hypothetical protein